MNTVKLKGKIVFDPIDKTKKHILQSSWKIIAMIMFEGDVSEYYAWFIKRRFDINLNKPLRGAHISFINDKVSDIAGNTQEERAEKWEVLKKKWNKKEVEISLNLDSRTNGKHWWLVVPEEERDLLHLIRSEIGLGRPHFGLHMSLGYANERNIAHSEYIHESIKVGFIKD